MMLIKLIRNGISSKERIMFIRYDLMSLKWIIVCTIINEDKTKWTERKRNSYIREYLL